MKYLLIFLLTACSSGATQIRVISTSDQSTAHCIEKTVLFASTRQNEPTT